MYERHFGLAQRPFRPVADASCYYPAGTHEQALTGLLRAVEEDEGLGLLTGAPGTGKTILAQCLFDRVGDKCTTALLCNCHFNGRLSLLQAISFDLSLTYAGLSEQELRINFADLCVKNYEAGRRTLLIVDEAQDLTEDLLEELRLLTNLEGCAGRACQVILLAQPSLLGTLEQPRLASFAQRLAVRPQLEPLGVHEAADYLVHQIRIAGGRPEQIMGDEALTILASKTRGVPRLLNQAGHLALTLAAAARSEQVDAEAALEALGRLGLENDEHSAEEPESVPAEPVLFLDANAPVNGSARRQA